MVLDPPGEKENEAPQIQIQHHPDSGINKKRDHGPIMVRDGDPVEPDAGPVIKSGFYRADPVTESHKVYRYDTKWAEVLAT